MWSSRRRDSVPICIIDFDNPADVSMRDEMVALVYRLYGLSDEEVELVEG